MRKILSDVFEQLKTLPWLATFLTISALISAFQMGFMLRLGSAIWPLLDKPQMLVSLIIWAAAVWILLKLLWSVLKIYKQVITRAKSGVNADKVDDVISIINFLSTSSQSKTGHYLSLALLGVAVTLIAINPFCMQNFTLPPILLLISAIACRKLLFEKKFRWIPLTGFSVFLLMSSLTLGAAWVDVSRHLAGTASLRMSGEQTTQNASVLMRNEHGIFAFVGEEEEITFFPWDIIHSVKSNKSIFDYRF